ncbi:hypothetical protein HDU79_000145, partial [Rhizoclosmatium sp. JEL0117]
PESVTTYCNFPENDRNTWTTPYLAAVDARYECLSVSNRRCINPSQKAKADCITPALSTNQSFQQLLSPCQATFQTHGQSRPARLHQPVTTSSQACNCGKGPDAKSIDTCICTGLFTESFSAYCNLPGNDQASWLNLYQDGSAARSNSCAKVGLPLTAIPVLSLPNNIPNPIKDTPTPAPLTPACNYVLDAFNQKIPGVSARSDSCAKVGLALTPIPLLSLPDNIPNPLKDTSASTSTSVVAPSPIPPTKTTSAAADAKTSTPSKPTTVVGSGAGSMGLGGALVLAVAVLI